MSLTALINVNFVCRIISLALLLSCGVMQVSGSWLSFFGIEAKPYLSPNQTYVNLEELNSTLVPTFTASTTVSSAPTKKVRRYDLKPNRDQNRKSALEDPPVMSSEPIPSQECPKCREMTSMLISLSVAVVSTLLCLLFITLYCHERRMNVKRLEAKHVARALQHVTDPYIATIL